jgi:hypothetical protein
MQLINRTPFAGGVFVDVDRTGIDTLVLVIKATFDIDGSEQLSLSDVQQDLSFTDVYAGEPGSSSLLYESDANWGRRATDIALKSYAYPAREGDRETEVGVRVGDVTKTAYVFGDRIWNGVLGKAHPSAPRAFERIPLVFERAFGGIDDSAEDPAAHETIPDNPVGRGLRAARSRRQLESILLPNVEDPENLIRFPEDRPSPVGFTFVPREWTPRTDFAGSYDAVWETNRMPLLPEDFDPRFYTAASKGLAVPFLGGGEVVVLRNLTLPRRDQFIIPIVDLQASFHVDAAPTSIGTRLDCVLIDTVNMKLVLVWHGCHPIQGLTDDIRWVLAEAVLRQ